MEVLDIMGQQGRVFNVITVLPLPHATGTSIGIYQPVGPTSTLHVLLAGVVCQPMVCGLWHYLHTILTILILNLVIGTVMLATIGPDPFV